MKKIYHLVFLLFTAILMTACTFPIAKDAAEFRAGFKADPNSFGNGFESYTVNRSMNEVLASLNKYAFSCLSGTTTMNGVETEENPALFPGKNKSIFILQRTMDFGPFGPPMEEQPEKGVYIIVLDIFKKTNSSVSVDFYKWSGMDMQAAAEVASVKAWLNGETGCLH